jgi:hypothetical protein
MREKILKVDLGKPLSNDASYGVALLAMGVVNTND